MAQSLAVQDYAIIFVVLAVSSVIGIYFRFSGGRQKTMEEFLMASKTMAVLPVAFSIMATFMSAIDIIGVPAEIYMYGMQMTTWLLGLPIGSLFASYACLPIYFDLDVSTSYEYLEVRFGKTTRLIAAFSFIVRTVLFTAVVLYTPAIALNAVTGISTWTSILTLSAVCIFYCSLGGLKAVLWTDVFQALLMYIAAISIVVKGTLILGFWEVVDVSEKGGRLEFFNLSPSLTERYTLWNDLIAGAHFGFEAYGTNQAQIQRLLSVGTLKKAQWAIAWSLVLIAIFKVFCYFLGMVLYALFYDCDPMQNPGVLLNSPDQMIPYIILKLLSGLLFLPGLCISGMFSGALSTVSSSLNSMTSVTMEDFIRPHCRGNSSSDTCMNMVAKFLAIAFGGLSLLMIITVSNFRGVLEAACVLTAIPVGPIVGVYILAMFTTKANEPGTLLGFVVGTIANAWIAIGSYLAEIYIEPLPRSTAGCLDRKNETLFIDNLYSYAHNESSLIGLDVRNITQYSNSEQGDVFPLFEVSFMWFSIIGTIISVIIGYLSSLIIRLWNDFPDVSPRCISPLVRSCYYTKKQLEMTMMMETNVKNDKTPAQFGSNVPSEMTRF
ncbi:putative sodium-dependent multivitamin transporter [Trichonephila inaurata madagascariensis]|uniref:Putative sodium-dependent multivitamin transporter n=1 Tax=Trichonephila inaurata madagascariensis TaxID=2747483 RepID=A0A8X6Y2L3_9ARAC|nr:putative sodium-dependent multivitamin transporter [Trichonephila inaurata madagascariensis]